MMIKFCLPILLAFFPLFLFPIGFILGHGDQDVPDKDYVGHDCCEGSSIGRVACAGNRLAESVGDFFFLFIFFFLAAGFV